MNDQSREPYQVQTPEPPSTPQRPDTSQQYLWTWRNVILIVSTSLILLYIGIYVSASLTPNFNLQHPEAVLGSISFVINSLIVEFLALVGSVYFLGLRRKRLNWPAFGLQPLSITWLGIACGAGVIECLLETGVSYGVQYLLKLPDTTQIQGMATQGLTWVNLVVLVALAGLAIPFAEELLFRGVIYTFIRERWGMWVGIIASALLYAIASLDLVAGSAAFVLGLVTAFVYERSKSLWAAVIVHIFSSMLSLIVFYVLTLPGMHLPIS